MLTIVISLRVAKAVILTGFANQLYFGWLVREARDLVVVVVVELTRFENGLGHS